MAGRPITNTSAKAQYKREWMRRHREQQKTQPMPINPHPLAEVLAQWSKQ